MRSQWDQKKIDVFRLSRRIEDIVQVVFESHSLDPRRISMFLAGVIRNLNDGNKTKQAILSLKSMLLLENSIPGLSTKYCP